ncbi:YesL family protein [uncultured Tessaracoccus sp.]|uniref:YesL family protein n=1 Tax=uncultured Tessaracoccus sp. TaxID=905023 RepID=UPI00260768B0|nr:YesL family protein [uncultured Tessaracoccus sp.]
MRSRLGPDSPLAQAISQFADAVVLNLLFLVCCLPVVTAGAAWTAMQATMVEVAREQGPRVSRRFWQHLCTSWRGATLAWLLVLALTVLLVWEYGVLGQFPQSRAIIVVQALVVTGLLVVALWAWWLFPLIGEGMSLGRAVRLALVLAFVRLPRGVVGLAAAGVPLLLLWLVDGGWRFVLPLMFVVGFALLAFVNAVLLARALPSATA